MTQNRRRIGATSRLQLPGVGFCQAARLVPYLSCLGIETMYLSPVLHARAGSTHGYDVVDPSELDPAFGTPDDFGALLSRLEEAGMNLLLDIVPNHLAASEENPMWTELLAGGPDSRVGGFFDVDWEAGDGRVLLPVLGEPLADAIAKGKIGLAIHGGELVVTYFDRFFPVAPGSVSGDAAAFLRSFEALDDAASEELLTALLADQHYRLAYWRRGADDLNYRRFFDIDDLVGVRLENEAAYEATHRFVLELARDDRIGGLRIDHIDGLADPARYLERLSSDLELNGPRPAVLVEKILAADEQLEADWETDGATGYDFATIAGGLFIDAGGAVTIASEMTWLTRDERSFAERVEASKSDVLHALFSPQLDRVARSFALAVVEDPAAGDLSLDSIRRAVAALVCKLDVYRTYGSAGKPVGPAGASRIKEAAVRAETDLDIEGRRALGVITSQFLDADRLSAARAGDAVAVAVAEFQQLAGAVMAKGAEDTAAFTPGALMAGVDVGGDPDRPWRSVEDFHDAMAERRRSTPSALNATSTHDSKRAEDVRCRLAVLSEMPAGWISAVEAFGSINAPLRGEQGGHAVPDAAEEIYLYETLVGSLPVLGGATPGYGWRIEEHMEKALREAKRHTSWTEPNERYEAIVRRFVSRILAEDNVAFLSLLEEVTDAIGPAAATSSLGLAVLRVAAPGVPDTYAGTERWRLDLVDPDNRRSVDFVEAAEVLSNLETGGASPSSLLSNWNDGRVKLAVLARALRLRRAHPETFEAGDYQRLTVVGSAADHVVAFARIGSSHVAVAAAVRKSLTLAGPGQFALGRCFGDGELVLPPVVAAPARELTDALTNRRLIPATGVIPLSELFSDLPVALLSTL